MNFYIMGTHMNIFKSLYIIDRMTMGLEPMTTLATKLGRLVIFQVILNLRGEQPLLQFTIVTRI